RRRAAAVAGRAAPARPVLRIGVRSSRRCPTAWTRQSARPNAADLQSPECLLFAHRTCTLAHGEHVERGALVAFLEREIGPEAKDTIVTVGQQLIEQGRKQGLEQGMKLGIEKERQRFQKLLLRLLRQRFGGAVDTQVEQRVASASVEAIEIWSERVA